MKLTPKEKFLARVRPDPVTGCWLWQGYLNESGYGCFLFEGRQAVAHRVSWMLFRGRIPFGNYVCHTCDVRACVNPDHLFLGTPAANSADARRKGRTRQGEQASAAKLTTAQVQQVLALLAEDKLYVTEIARQFGVSQSAIHAIKSGESWKHLQRPGPADTHSAAGSALPSNRTGPVAPSDSQQNRPLPGPSGVSEKTG